MSIPSDFDPLAWGERRYIQPIMTSATKWSNEPSFGMTITGTGRVGASPYVAFNGKGSLGENYGWGGYSGGAAKGYYCLMTFEHPLKIVGVQFFNGDNTNPRYYDFYGVQDDGTEVLLWHTQRGYGNFADNMRCENPRYFKCYKFV